MSRLQLPLSVLCYSSCESEAAEVISRGRSRRSTEIRGLEFDVELWATSMALKTRTMKNKKNSCDTALSEQRKTVQRIMNIASRSATGVSVSGHHRETQNIRVET
jgi:hypothetical protein